MLQDIINNNMMVEEVDEEVEASVVDGAIAVDTEEEAFAVVVDEAAIIPITEEGKTVESFCAIDFYRVALLEEKGTASEFLNPLFDLALCC